MTRVWNFIKRKSTLATTRRGPSVHYKGVYYQVPRDKSNLNMVHFVVPYK